MKKGSLISGMLTLILFAGVLFMSSCGKEGPAGADGTDGVDGNMVCMECHNLENKANVHMQYEMSQHHEGEFVGYAGGRQDCAKCHSNEGFIETQYTGADTTASADGVPYPTAIGCVTCHSSHSTFDFENDGDDYALRGTEPIKLLADNTIEVDFGGSSNLCIICHEPRRTGPTPDANDSFFISSSHWGPHHGPQGSFLYGVLGYEFDGAESYATPGSHAHMQPACTGCHMETYSNSKGGHTWWPNLDNCTSCHEGANSFDVKGVQTEVHDLLVELGDLLKAEGSIDADGHPVRGTFHIDVAGATYNYIGIEEDRSLGVHNPDYIIALLKNSIDAIK
jgi:hypothetical protein